MKADRLKQTDKNRERHTDGLKDRQAGRQTKTDEDRQKQTERHKDRLIDR